MYCTSSWSFPGWYEKFIADVAANPSAFGAADREEALRDAVRLALDDQIRAGLDRITDGEMQLNALGEMVDRIWGGLAQYYPHITMDQFVVMPNHFHLLITPAYEIPLEKVIQYIKGGFSFRAKKELEFRPAIWQESFTNHRIRDADDTQIIARTLLKIR